MSQVFQESFKYELHTLYVVKFGINMCLAKAPVSGKFQPPINMTTDKDNYYTRQKKKVRMYLLKNTYVVLRRRLLRQASVELAFAGSITSF